MTLISRFCLICVATENELVIVVLNFTPVPRYGYRVGVPEAGTYQEILNSDSAYYNGSNVGNEQYLQSEAEKLDGSASFCRFNITSIGRFDPETCPLMNILYVTSEVYPLIKTGGLGDVSGSLPRALLRLKQDVRILVPAYQSLLAKIEDVQEVAQTSHYGYPVRILQTTLPGTRVKVLLVDCAPLFDRPGNPYLDATGVEWHDNALRFALFSQVAVDVALNRLAFDWPVDVVNCNDWQSGLVPALLARFKKRPATVFTIHNLAYQGLYPKQTFLDLGLPADLWSMHGVEFHDYFSFIKGGLNFADRINTVSPQYAQEIQTEEFGFGLQNLLLARYDRLSGILNGIDTEVWNPGTDGYLEQKYNRRSLPKKSLNKLKLQQLFSLSPDSEIPLIGLISRLVEQKGLDLILESMPELLKMRLQMVFLGSGELHYQNELKKLASAYPDTIAVYIGYDERLSHQIEAACDIYLMPSLFEPCGLNQLYSLRYGTIPLVTGVGGLADSVINYTDQSFADKSATGFVLEHKNAQSLVESMRLALSVYPQKKKWKQLQITAMQQDFSWQSRANDYIQLYEQAVLDSA